MATVRVANPVLSPPSSPNNELGSIGGKHVFKAAVLPHPVRDIRGDPSDNSQYSIVVSGEIAAKNRLVVSDSVAQIAQIVQLRVCALPGKRLAMPERTPQAGPPQSHFIVGPKTVSSALARTQ